MKHASDRSPAHLSAAHDQEVNRRAVESAQRKVSEAKAQHRNKPNDKALAELRQAKAELAQAEKKLNDAKREEDKHARAGRTVFPDKLFEKPSHLTLHQSTRPR